MSVSASRRLVSETSRATHLRRGAGCTGSLNSKASLIAFSALIFYKASPLTGEANEATWNLHQSEPSTVAFHRLDRKYSAKIFAFVMKKMPGLRNFSTLHRNKRYRELREVFLPILSSISTYSNGWQSNVQQRIFGTSDIIFWRRRPQELVHKSGIIDSSYTLLVPTRLWCTRIAYDAAECTDSAFRRG